MVNSERSSKVIFADQDRWYNWIGRLTHDLSWHAGKLGEWWQWHAHTFRTIQGLNAKMITLAENVFNLESINVWIISKQSKTTENKFHSFSSQFPTETKFWISLVDSVPYEVCYFLVRDSPNRSLVACPTSVLWLAPWNLLRGKWLVSTWKMRFVIHATRRNLHQKPVAVHR